jgi:hypothetical protein
MAKLKHTTRRQRVAPPSKAEKSKYPDAALIRLCVSITADLAAFQGCSEADPDGNNIHAEPIWSRILERANRTIEQAGNTQATTWAGLASKAVAMLAILDDDCGGVEARSANFYRSFAADVKRLGKEYADKQFHDDRAAATVAAARLRQSQAGADE